MSTFKALVISHIITGSTLPTEQGEEVVLDIIYIYGYFGTAKAKRCDGFNVYFLSKPGTSSTSYCFGRYKYRTVYYEN